MTKEYKTFSGLARAFERNLGELQGAFAAAMEVGAIAVVGAAREELGHYQREDMGPAAPWEELADVTKADRVRQGYPENDPELRTGEMRDGIKHQAGPKEFVVGSEDPVAFYQVMGTPKMPPRDFLSPALHRNIPFILKTIGEAAETTLAGTK